MKFNLAAAFYLIEKDGSSRKVFCKDNDLFVNNFAVIMYAGFIYTSQNVTKTDGTTTSFGWGGSSWPLTAPAGNANYGLLVGTGTTAPQSTNYNLVSKINHGTGSGQLSYGTTTTTNITQSGSTLWFKVQRAFTNLSGESITVNEIGIVMANSTTYVMIARDVISGGVTINNGQVGTLTYTFSSSL